MISSTAWYEIIRQSVSSNNSIRAISFSAAMHSVIAVDSEGKPLTNAIIWADTRSVKQAAALRQSDTGTLIYNKTGTPVHPMSPLCKIIWLRETRPQLFAQVHKFISVKEYLFYVLFGKYLVDYSIASATGLFDITVVAMVQGSVAGSWHPHRTIVYSGSCHA